MQDNQLDNMIKEKLQGKIMASPEMEDRIKAKIEEQKRLAKEQNNKKHKKYYFMKPLISVAAVAVIAVAIGINLKTNNMIDEIFESTTTVSAIKSIEPTKLQSGIIANDTEFIIQADENSDKESVQKSIYVEPAIDYTIEETDKENVYKLKFNQNIPDNTIVKLEYVKDKITQDSWAYQTSDKLSITSAYPDSRDHLGAISPNTTIAIEFSYANIENFEENVSIYPNIDGKWEHMGKVWRFKPTIELEEKEYTVTVKNGITAGKEKLESDYTFNFIVRKEYSEDKIMNNIYTIDGINTYKPDENVKINYYWENYYKEERLPDISKIEISKFENEEDFINYLENQNPEKALNTEEYEFQIDTKSNCIELNRSLASGYYVASIKDLSGREVFNTPIQINSLNAYALETEKDIIVWVADDNGLAKNIKVEYAGKEQKTDSEGIAKFEEIADGSEKIKYAKIGNGKNKLVVGLYNYKFNNYPGMYFYTDRLMYKNTDSIKIWGFVPKILFHDNIEDEFYLELNNEERQKIKINEDGTFNHEIKLQNHIDENYAIIKLYYKDEYLEGRGISIQNYELQNYEYEIISDKNYAYVGTNYEFDVKVKHITGLVVPNKEVAVKFGEEIFYATTAEDGCAHFSLKIEDEGIDYSGLYGREISVFNGNNIEYTVAETYKDIYILTTNIETKIKESEKNIYEIELYKLLIDRDIDFYSNFEKFREDVYNTEIKVNLIEEVSQRNLVYYDYNDYTQELEPQYSWDTTDNIINLDTITTNNGIAKFDARNVELKEDTEDISYSYNIEFEFKDPDGKIIKNREYFSQKGSYENERLGYYYESFYDGVSDELYEIPRNIDYGYYYTYRYFLERPENQAFSIGDTQNFTLYESIQNSKKEIKNEGKILRIVFQEDISKTEIIKDNDFSYTFEEQDFPGIKMTTAYYYNGKFYRMPIYYFDFKEEDKKLDIEIDSDKEVYKPGEEVTVTIKTTNNDKPIKTCVNISVVNEAAFVAGEDDSNILEKIYKNKEYPCYIYSSYTDFLDDRVEGGGGGGEEPRGDFADTAYFDSVYTNNNGEAKIKFKLPDDVTKYRITAHAVNEDLYVGVNATNIVSALDFFIQSVEPRNVKTTDDLVLNATSIATEKYDVDYEFTIKELNKTLTATATTNSIATVNFGKLKFGTYHVVIKGKGNNNKDAIEYEINIVESSQEVKNKTTLKINENAKISPNKNPISLEIYNKNMEQYIKYIDFIEKTQTSRLDTQIAYNEIIKIKNQYYQTKEMINSIDVSEYFGESGFKNLSNSQEDILLTALIRYYSKDYYALAYWEKDFKDLVKEDVNLFEIYLLAAAKNEPVLKDLIYLKEEKDIDNYNKLLLTLSFEFLGDYQTAKDYYNTINLNEEEINEYKSIIATIETFIDKTNAVKKINEMIEENPADEYLRFAILSFFKNSSEELNKEEKVEIVCGNNKETITLKGMQVKTYSINNENLKDISFKTDSDDLMVSYYYNSLLENVEDENIVQDIQMDLYGELKKNNEVWLSIVFNDYKEGDIRIALPNSLRLALSQSEFSYYDNGYYLRNNNIDYIIIHKNENCTYINLPLYITYEGNYKFENVVMQDEGTYHISNSFDLDIK